jgi:hypothetical protein
LRLPTVTLSNWLKEIGKEAFCQYTSLECIAIPNAVKVIDDSAFEDCSNLTNLEFCNNIKDFVSCDALGIGGIRVFMKDP